MDKEKLGNNIYKLKQLNILLGYVHLASLEDTFIINKDDAADALCYNYTQQREIINRMQEGLLI